MGVADSYLIEVRVDALGVTTVQAVRSEKSGQVGYQNGGGYGGEYGCSCPTSYPADLASDLSAAVDSARVLSQTYVAWSALVTFSGESQKQVNLGGAVQTALYLVGATSPDGTPVFATDRTQSGFVLHAAAPLGSLMVPVQVSVVVVVPLVPAAPLFGEVYYHHGDSATVTIPLDPIALPTTAYRVVVDPDGAFPASAVRASDHFTITLGAAVPVGGERRVRYGVVFR